MPGRNAKARCKPRGTEASPAPFPSAYPRACGIAVFSGDLRRADNELFKLVNYVEYGDPVGNYSANPPVLGGFLTGAARGCTIGR